MIKYKICENRCANGIARETEAHLNNGWEIAGPLIVDAGMFYQPIRKEVDDPDGSNSGGAYDRAMKGI